MIYFYVLLSFVSTFIGGLVGIKYKDKRHLILGFTAGVLLAVVAFDIFPEIVSLVNVLHKNTVEPMIALVIGFLLFHVMEKTLLIHHAQEDAYGRHKHPLVGAASALALTGHSFLDGVGIGLGFQVSPSLGIMVAIAVISHDFSDGLNTVSMALLHKNTQKNALYFLIGDAIAPVLGALSTILFTIPERYMLWYLGFFAGFLLYIGASDILPEAHSQNSSMRTVGMTILGVLFIYAISRLT